MTNGGGKSGGGWRLGAILQGLVLGMLVAAAIVELRSSAGDVRLFRYQNF